MFVKFVRMLDLKCQPLVSLINVELPIGHTVGPGRVCQCCEIDAGNHRVATNLIVMDVVYYDVILGMDCSDFGS